MKLLEKEGCEWMDEVKMRELEIELREVEKERADAEQERERLVDELGDVIGGIGRIP